MIEWRSRYTAAISIVFWALLTLVTFASSHEYTFGNLTGIGMGLALMVLLLALATKYTVRGLTRDRFEPVDDGTPSYPVACTACGLGTQLCAQKGRIIVSQFGRDLADVGAIYRMFCPDCGADFLINKRDCERCIEAGEDLQSFQRGDIDEEEYAERVFELEKDLTFVSNPDPRLKRDQPAEPDVEVDPSGRGFQ